MSRLSTFVIFETIFGAWSAQRSSSESSNYHKIIIKFLILFLTFNFRVSFTSNFFQFNPKLAPNFDNTYSKESRNIITFSRSVSEKYLRIYLMFPAINSNKINLNRTKNFFKKKSWKTGWRRSNIPIRKFCSKYV